MDNPDFFEKGKFFVCGKMNCKAMMTTCCRVNQQTKGLIKHRPNCEKEPKDMNLAGLIKGIWIESNDELVI